MIAVSRFACIKSCACPEIHFITVISKNTQAYLTFLYIQRSKTRFEPPEAIPLTR